MIARSELPSISSILTGLGINPNQHGRTKCPIHQGENKQAFSYNDAKGLWYCFRCGFGGDAIDLVKRSLDVDFVGALRWLGLSSDFIKAPDPAVLRQYRIRTGLKNWAHDLQRELRDQFYHRSKIEMNGKRRLLRDPEDCIGWELLSVAYTGIPFDELERRLDLLNGTDEQQLEIFRQMRSAE